MNVLVNFDDTIKQDSKENNYIETLKQNKLMASF